LQKFHGKSKYERLTSKFLLENNINFETEKKFEDLKNKSYLPFDFYLPDKNILLEIHGGQHYIPMSYRNGEEKFKETIYNDEKKKDYAIINNYNYICIDARSNLENQLQINLI
jgi:hypothetical protein